MRARAMLLAAVLVVVGVVVLGTRWEGIEVAPGVWRDSVSLQQWGVLWASLGVLGAAGAAWLPSWGLRILVPLPLLAWIGWSLAGGTLLPIAFAIYAAPTLLAWGAGLLTGDAARQLARSVKRGRA